MEPISIGAAVVAVLVPYLAKFGEGMVSGAGETAWDKIYKTIRGKLAGDPADASLEQLEQQPQNKELQRQVATAVNTQAGEDKRFNRQLQTLLSTAVLDRSVRNAVTQAHNRGLVEQMITLGPVSGRGHTFTFTGPDHSINTYHVTYNGRDGGGIWEFIHSHGLARGVMIAGGIFTALGLVSFLFYVVSFMLEVFEQLDSGPVEGPQPTGGLDMPEPIWLVAGVAITLAGRGLLMLGRVLPRPTF